MKTVIGLAATLAVLAIFGCAASQGRTTGEAPPVVVMAAEDADHLWVDPQSKDELGSGGEFHIYVDPETYPEARASFAKFALGAGGSLPVHRHEKTEEVGYFLSGEGTVTVFENDQAKEIPVREGHVVYVPPGAWHTIKNTGDEPFSLVFATIPNDKKGLLSFFRRIGVKPGEEAERLSAEEFARIASEHDLILRPPD